MYWGLNYYDETKDKGKEKVTELNCPNCIYYNKTIIEKELVNKKLK